MRRIIIVSIGFLLLMGCGSKRGTGGTVSGTITYKGQPVNGAMLRFYPASGDGKEAPIAIPVSQEGSFSGSSIPPGEYKIVVEPSQAPPGGRRTLTIPKGMDPSQAAEMKQKYEQAYGQDKPTIAFPNKYKNITTTDLKCTINQGNQKLPLDLKD